MFCCSLTACAVRWFQEMLMLQSYAPDIDLSVIEKLSTAFMDLRAMQDSGDLLYPCAAISCLFPTCTLGRV